MLLGFGRAASSGNVRRGFRFERLSAESENRLETLDQNTRVSRRLHRHGVERRGSAVSDREDHPSYFFAVPIFTDFTMTVVPLTSPITSAILPANLSSSAFCDASAFSVYTLPSETSA